MPETHWCDEMCFGYDGGPSGERDNGPGHEVQCMCSLTYGPHSQCGAGDNCMYALTEPGGD